ncbi:MAG: hypothetical protein J6Y22_11560 [Paludibacteraceae bacterium]|nr:hypothetical protein [Paludibacteraceae bacterium]
MRNRKRTIVKYILLWIFTSSIAVESEGYVPECIDRSDFRAELRRHFVDVEYLDSINGKSDKICIFFRDTFNHKEIRSFRVGVANTPDVPFCPHHDDGYIFYVTHADSVVVDKTKLRYSGKNEDVYRGKYEVNGYVNENIGFMEMIIPPNITKMAVYLYPNPNDVRFHIEDRVGEIDSVSFEMRKDRLNRINDQTYYKYCFDRASSCMKTIRESDLESSKENKYPYYNLTRQIYLDEILYFNVCVYYKDGRKECTDYKFEYQPNVESVINIW